MNWITEKIAIGNVLDAQDADLLKREQVEAIFGLTNALDRYLPADLNVKAIVIEDLKDDATNRPGEFVRMVSRLVHLTRSHARVLVHCQAGQSRSAAVVAGYLMKTEKLSIDEAVRRVAAKREIRIHPALFLLLDYLEED
jgi:protein-tyrosine phosphatase